MERIHHKQLPVFHYCFILLLIAGVFFFEFGPFYDSTVLAQENQIVFIEGTVPVSEGLTDVLAAAVERSGIAARIPVEYFAVTDLVERDGWMLVSVVGLSGITDLAKWNIINNGVWFSSILVEGVPGKYTNAAVYGTDEYQALAAATPESVVSSQARQFIVAPEIQQAAGEDFIIPFLSGYEVKYGPSGIHDGWGTMFTHAVDLMSDGDTSAGHTPNYLIAASSGAVTYRCTPDPGDTASAFVVGEFLYAHVAVESMTVQVGDYVSQATYLGELQPGDIIGEKCGWASQQPDVFHVHFCFNTTSLTLSGWTLNMSTWDWTNGTDIWEFNSSYGTWQMIGEPLAPPDLIIDDINFVPANPVEGQAVMASVQVRNAGGATFTPFTVDLYFDNPPEVCGDFGEYSAVIDSLGAGETAEVQFTVTGLTAGSHQVDGYVDTGCVVDESGDPTDEDNEYGPDTLVVGAAPSTFFADGFETGDLSSWTRVNDGKGYLYACGQAAVNGDWGACVARGDNDRRKQLIDETPINQKSFSSRFIFDINGLTMGEGERFRFMQIKMDGERPGFIVLKHEGGKYYIQLNVKENDLTKTKTGWYLLTNEPHLIEVSWQAASAPGANDGYALLYIDELLQESLLGLDTDELYISDFRMGFTSRLVGKSITGIFYLEDVGTSISGYLGAP